MSLFALCFSLEVHGWGSAKHLVRVEELVRLVAGAVVAEAEQEWYHLQVWEACVAAPCHVCEQELC